MCRRLVPPARKSAITDVGVITIGDEPPLTVHRAVSHGPRPLCTRAITARLILPPAANSRRASARGPPTQSASQSGSRCRPGPQRRLRAAPTRCPAVSAPRRLPSATPLAGRRSRRRTGRSTNTPVVLRHDTTVTAARVCANGEAESLVVLHRRLEVMHGKDRRYAFHRDSLAEDRRSRRSDPATAATRS